MKEEIRKEYRHGKMIGMSRYFAMKKFVTVLLVTFLLFGNLIFATAEPSDTKIIVNGIPLVLLDDNNNAVQPIEEASIVYVPLTAFLNALNMTYTQSDGVYNITLSRTDEQQPTPSPTQTPYEKLDSKEKKILDTLLENIYILNDPASIHIVDIRDGANGHQDMRGCYVICIAEANSSSRRNNNWYYAFPNSKMWQDNIFYYENSTKGNYDIKKINVALRFKLKELGF